MYFVFFFRENNKLKRKTVNLILTGELWTQRVMLYYVENVPGAWSYPENIGSVVIASNLGLIFQADFIDVNADGKNELHNMSSKKVHFGRSMHATV